MGFKKGNKHGNRFGKDNQPKSRKNGTTIKSALRKILSLRAPKDQLDNEFIKKFLPDKNDLTNADLIAMKLVSIAIDLNSKDADVIKAIMIIAKTTGNLNNEAANVGHFTVKSILQWSDQDWADMAGEMGYSKDQVQDKTYDVGPSAESYQKTMQELDERGELDV